MIEVSDFKKGVCLEYKKAPMVIIDVNFTTPTARGGTTIAKTRLRNLVTGQLISDSIRSGETFPEVDMERHMSTYMYADASQCYFMDDETYEQFELTKESLETELGLMKEGLGEIQAMLIDGHVVGITLPMVVELEVVECDPVVKGATAKAQMKNGVLETGGAIMVPPYLESGEIVRVDTRDGHFIERAKK